MPWYGRAPPPGWDSAARARGRRNRAARTVAWLACPPSAGRAADLDALQDGERVGDEHRDRVVGADQIRDDRLLVDAHEPDGQARLDLVGDAGLVQADDALL